MRSTRALASFPTFDILHTPRPVLFQGGRQLLLDAALEAIKVAEDPATEGNRVLMARSFHTATVYLEVLSSFNAVSPGACVLEIG